MGTCECADNIINKKELKYFFTRNKQIIDEQAEISKKEKQKKTRIIKKFIIKNTSRLYRKEKYKALRNKAQSLFFEKEELNFKYDESYFKQKINNKINDYFKQKENIIKDLFHYKLIDSLHSFQKLKDKISTHHNKDIFINQKEYLNDLVKYLNEHNLIKKKITNSNLIKQLLVKMSLKDNINIDNERRIYAPKKTVKEKRLKKDINNDNNNSNEEERKNNDDIKKMKTKKEEKGNISWEQRNIEELIKQEIDNMFDVCFGSSKRNFTECQKKSIFLKILLEQENQKNPQINFTWELRKLIKLLYYIYLLKKYNFLSDTNNCFYKINPSHIKRKSVIKDKIILKQRDSKFENMLKVKFLKKAISQKIKNDRISPLESNTMNSMSSILSEEDEKECNSLISTKNDFKLLKSMTNNNDNKIIKLKIEEEKVNEYKNDTELDNGELTNRQKTSFQELLQQTNNLKMSKNLRINQRTHTGQRNNHLIFTEYYKGQFDETIYLYAGLGTLVSQNLKKLYNGTFRYGKKEGMGILYLLKDDNNMEYYMGEFRQNKIEGYGIRIKINNSDFLFQEGLFESELFIRGKYKKIKHKNDIIITINYEGEMKNNKFSGSGKIIDKKYTFNEKDGNYSLDQKIEYTGEFLNGKKNGKGKEIFNNILDPNKNYEYEGNFVNGLKDGFGIIIYDSNNFVKKFEGFFEKDKPFQIYGIVHFKSGDVYEGFFENNIKEYLGLYSFYDMKSKKIIEQYFGGFLDDSKNGIGKTIVQDKEVKMLLGPYKRGEKEGQFQKLIYKNVLIEKKKKRRKCVTPINFFKSDKYNYKRDAKLPKKIIKSYPVYEENEMVDINNNYFLNDYLDN